MANKYRNTEYVKPPIIQTNSSTQLDTTLNKAKQVRRDQDNVKNVSIGIVDIDTAFKYFLETQVKPIVEADGQFSSVPVLYASPEKWVSAQQRGFLMDDNGKLLSPLIVFRRSTISVDSNQAKLRLVQSEDYNQYFERKYTSTNRYDQFSQLTGQVPKKEFMSVTRPDYVQLEYELNIWCDYVEQLNRLIEQLIYFQGRPVGDRYKFTIKSDAYSFENEQTVGEDRVVKANVNLTTHAYIIPEYGGLENNTKRRISVGKVSWSSQIEGEGGSTNKIGNE